MTHEEKVAHYVADMKRRGFNKYTTVPPEPAGAAVCSWRLNRSSGYFAGLLTVFVLGSDWPAATTSSIGSELSSVRADSALPTA
jgi:hypothetical protein